MDRSTTCTHNSYIILINGYYNLDICLKINIFCCSYAAWTIAPSNNWSCRSLIFWMCMLFRAAACLGDIEIWWAHYRPFVTVCTWATLLAAAYSGEWLAWVLTVILIVGRCGLAYYQEGPTLECWWSVIHSLYVSLLLLTRRQYHWTSCQEDSLQLLIGLPMLSNHHVCLIMSCS